MTNSYTGPCLGSCGTQLVPKGSELVDDQREHKGRRLCEACYGRATHDGTLARYPRLTRRRGELLREYRELRTLGYREDEAAAKLNVTFEAITTALRRETREWVR